MRGRRTDTRLDGSIGACAGCRALGDGCLIGGRPGYVAAMNEREEHDRPSDQDPADEGQGASKEDAEEQAGQPGSEGQGDDGQASGNPKNAG